VIDSQGAYFQRLLPYREFQSATAFLLILGNTYANYDKLKEG